MAPYIFSILPGNLVLKCAINERLNRKDKEIVYKYELIIDIIFALE